jgi:N-acetylmuramoyl-L-alanine amidase
LARRVYAARAARAGGSALHSPSDPGRSQLTRRIRGYASPHFAPRAGALLQLTALLTATALGCAGAAVASAATSAATAGPLAGKIIGIDPGHNGLNYTDPAFLARQVWNGREWEDCDTTGTETASGYTEARFNFNVAAYLRADLLKDGAHVVMTRWNNWSRTVREPARQDPGPRTRERLY